ncbi:MAG: hypothetical protein ACRDTV_25685 [Mycobacterium sp.]
MPSPSDTGAHPHFCHAQGCDTEVAPQLFMCRPHWSLVPPALRASINETYRPGQEVDKKPSAEYLTFATAAIAEVAHKEARHRGRKPRTPVKPVQLTLFELR